MRKRGHPETERQRQLSARRIPPPNYAMTKITTDQIKAACEVASAVFDGDVSTPEGAQRLNENHGLNLGSARDFIENYRRLMEGREFQRTLSLEAMDYFLHRIEVDRGAAAVDNAIAAAYAHLDYYAGLERGGPQPSLRKLIDKWAEKRAAHRDFGAVQAQFSAAVERALGDSPALRRARLGEAPRLPQKTRVVTEAYIRNPDVVAEVLIRAKGACERCAKPAPFIRRSDCTPYLEVHHRVQLSAGGEDVVENAIALCPNCHRELHYGKLD
ncbi:HNH endonuclease [Burkholderia cenocepacia]|uniref:HNH endonuclease n=1 Tax=Burkholderia cenocepacia TaxID=95486 RepID=UPI002AB78DA2|nr:HNH endonuclease signature motif containing protein [Burkholderia cenocepacia]